MEYILFHVKLAMDEIHLLYKLSGGLSTINCTNNIVAGNAECHGFILFFRILSILIVFILCDVFRLPITPSHTILPIKREFERTMRMP